MKLTKLMLSACVAALALVSCNKDETTPDVSNRLKTVEVSLENVALTKEWYPQQECQAMYIPLSGLKSP